MQVAYLYYYIIYHKILKTVSKHHGYEMSLLQTKFNVSV
jgi:hypothetical protein